MERNQAGTPWWGKGVVYALSSALAGAASEAVLGAVGGLFPSTARIGIASVLALAAVALGAGEYATHRVWLPQRDRETPQRWMQAGALRWAIRNGATLGIGAASRLGFWLWYAIPIGALLLGRAEAGAILYSAYSATRGVAAWGILLGLQRLVGPEWVRWLLAHKPVARRVAASQLVALGIMVAAAVG